jgi:hypothetical protein
MPTGFCVRQHTSRLPTTNGRYRTEHNTHPGPLGQEAVYGASYQETVFFGFVEGAIGCGHSCRTGQNPQHFEEFGHAVALCPFLQ